MKKSVMQKWVKALRSGRYKQTTGKLKTTEGYCCLGVLCEISKVSEFKQLKNGEFQYMKANGVLPKTIQKWAGMDTDDGSFTVAGDCDALTSLNDDGISFKEIADIIQENYKEL